MTSKFRALPSVNLLLDDDRVKHLVESYSRESVLVLVRQHLDDLRHAIGNGSDSPTFDDLVDSIQEKAASIWQPWPRPLINATGVILHTNLGRAPLSLEATEAASQAARGYSDLELDLEQGTRGSRQAHVSRLLSQFTGAEAALVLNNNASAMLLGLASLAYGKEVIVSRGEAVEIGGGFRVPDVLRQSGATLVEVGTTNRTYASDYEAAITENTAVILKVHSSNFRITGFTHAPETQELVELGSRHDIPVLHDLGSGCLIETEQFGLAHEPTPQDSLSAGVDLVFFSGDKLLGGPQAGIVAGKIDFITRLSRYPLARAIRIDKMGMAALSATLLHDLKDEAKVKVPVWRMIAFSPEDLLARAEDWVSKIESGASVNDSFSTIGGGSLPGETLPTKVVVLTPSGSAENLASRLRQGHTPIIGRIEDDRVLLDPRTVLPEEDDTLVKCVRGALE